MQPEADRRVQSEVSIGRVILAGALVIVGAALLAILVITFVWFLNSRFGVEASLVTTAGLGAIAWIVKSTWESRREHRRVLAKDKQDQYFEFMEHLLKVFDAGKGDGPLDPDFLREVNRWGFRLILVGSDDVVRAWNNLRQVGAAADDKYAALNSADALILAMRKDCGHRTFLTSFDVLSVFLNDAASHRSGLVGKK